MDRDRLKQVQQTDITESRVNQEFIDWLKNRGPTYLLIILVGLVAWVGYHRWQEMQRTAKSNAYFDLEEAREPESLELVAQDHEGISSVPELARLKAADMHLFMTQTGREINAPDQTLDAAAIEEHRDEARRLYRLVYDATRNDPARRLLAIESIFGLAAVAETAGEFDRAEELYNEAIELAGDAYPRKAEQAQHRRDTLPQLRNVPEIPASDEVPRDSIIDPLLRDVIGELGESSPEPPAETTEDSAPDEDGS